MKKSYKLFGALYDRIPSFNGKISITNNDSTILDYSEEDNLFDFPYKKRSINLSNLFSIENKKVLNSIITELKTCDYVIINIDINSDNKIVDEFINKRVQQIIYLFKSNDINNVSIMTN